MKLKDRKSDVRQTPTIRELTLEEIQAVAGASQTIPIRKQRVPG